MADSKGLLKMNKDNNDDDETPTPPFTVEFEDDPNTCVLKVGPIDDAVRAKQIHYKLQREFLTLGINIEGATTTPMIDNEELFGPVLCDESFWMIDDVAGQRFVSVELVKQQARRWDYPFKSKGCKAAISESGKGDDEKEQRTSSSSSSSSSANQQAVKLFYQAQSLGNAAAAIPLLQEAIALESQDPSVRAIYRIQLSGIYRELRQLKKCAEQLDLATFDIPFRVLEDRNSNDLSGDVANLVMAINKLADVRKVLADPAGIDQSIASMKRILQYLPENRMTKNTLENLLIEVYGNEQEALQLADSVASADDPGQGDELEMYQWAVMNAALYSASMGNHTAAKAYFDKGYELLRKGLMDGFDQTGAFMMYRMVNELKLGDHSGFSLELDEGMVAITKAGPEKGGDMVKLPSEGCSFPVEYTIASTWAFIRSTPIGRSLPPSLFSGGVKILQLAMDASWVLEEDALVLEFGVWHGRTLRRIADNFPTSPIHGFDTFEGLPEDWGVIRRGAYSAQGDLPDGLPANVKLHVGLFSDTLPGFLDENPGNIRFINVDCDLYSSTKDVFDHVHERIVPGTVIHFDEFVANDNWENDEYKAFQEAVKEYGWSFEYLAFGLYSKKGVVRITGIGSTY